MPRSSTPRKLRSRWRRRSCTIAIASPTLMRRRTRRGSPPRKRAKARSSEATSSRGAVMVAARREGPVEVQGGHAHAEPWTVHSSVPWARRGGPRRVYLKTRASGLRQQGRSGGSESLAAGGNLVVQLGEPRPDGPCRDETERRAGDRSRQ